MSNLESKASKMIGAKMAGLDPGSDRYQVLEVARRFKKSWIDLGGMLWRVRAKRLHEKWGFDKFEQYCQQELRIKPQTAAKLTASYAFLREEEPGVLRRDGVEKPVPDVQVVDFLRRLREKQQLPAERFAEIKQQALREEVPPAQLRRQVREQLPPPARSRQAVLRQLLDQAHRLADSLAALTGIPHAIVERALALVDDLRSLADPGGKAD